MVAVAVAVPVPGDEGYSEVGLIGLQLRKVLSRVEARQEENSQRLEELGKMMSEMRSNGAVTGLSLGCTTSSGESVVTEGSEGKARAWESEKLVIGLEKLMTSVEAMSER